MKIYILPQTNNKAVILIDDDNAATLISYGTPIIKQTAGGRFVRLWDGWTQTTGRHIKKFCELNKAQFRALPLNEESEG